jgi:uncharacterized membrane-anchored protein YhcB (DUF1043 family)
MDKWDIILGFIIGVIVGAYVIFFLTPALSHPDYTGAYLQAARNCVQSHDWNSSWCGWLK